MKKRGLELFAGMGIAIMAEYRLGTDGHHSIYRT
jgi:hypothetical protein